MTDRMKQPFKVFTQADQLDRLIEAHEEEPDRGFMARLMTLCSLPRTRRQTLPPPQGGLRPLRGKAGSTDVLPITLFQRYYGMIFSWILTVGGIKGGSGKTTVATNLACIAAGQDLDVLLVDADDQETASDFHSGSQGRLSGCSALYLCQAQRQVSPDRDTGARPEVRPYHRGYWRP